MQEGKLTEGNLFHERLKMLMNAGDWNQSRLAAAVGVSAVSVNKWIKQGQMPKAEQLYRVAKCFEVSMEYLLHGDEEESGSETDGNPPYRPVHKPRHSTKLFERRLIELEKRLKADREAFRLKTGEMIELTERMMETNDDIRDVLDALDETSKAGGAGGEAIRPHLLAAAGSPIGAEVLDWDEESGVVRVQVAGLSMLPLINDGEVIEMWHKSTSRNPYMKKGLIYLVEYDGGYTVKRYNTRRAYDHEKGEDWVERGRVKILESINPDFSEIIIKQPLEWVAWYEEQK